MSFIIVWRNNHRSPFVDTDSRNFLETYPTQQEAEDAAREIEKNENATSQSPHYFNWKVYEEV